jgi:glycosyltransferase involved in cell wall biosynthesis
MKILHIVPSYIPAYRYGGPIRSVHGLCKGLSQRGHEVHVFTTNVDGPNNSDVPLGVPVDIDGVKVWYYPSQRFRRLYYSSDMKKALKQSINSFDIVHLHSVFLWPTLLGARICQKNQVPYLVSPRGMLVKDLIRRKSRWIKSLWIKLFDQYTLEHASGIHVTSKLEEDELKPFAFKLPPIFMIPNGIDIPDAINQKRAKDNENTILFLGRVNWEKGLDRLIETMAYISKGKLIIAGNDEEGYQKTLEQIAIKFGVTNRIQFIGAVYNEDKEKLLNSASMLVLPSYSENFGIVVLEAMSYGCPVIVTPEVGLADVVAKYGAGLVCEGEPDILGKNINRLLDNPDLGVEMGKMGQRVVQEEFSWAVIARQMERVYQKVSTTN